MKSKKVLISLSLVFVLAALLFIPTGMSKAANASNVSFTAVGGWLESAYVKWSPVSGASGYNVYCKGSSDSSYKQLDSMLIRKYASYYRADALGLKAGTYVMKVVPIINGKEDTSKAAVSSSIKVEAHDRSGFAFVNGTSSGAYNEDGTLKSNAVVLYVSQATKDTVSCDVVTSSKGTTTSATGIQNILTLIKKGYDKRPFDIRIVGKVTDPSVTDKGDLIIDSSTFGLTLEGVGDDATLYGWGIRIKNSSNVEIRNIGTMLVDSNEGDNVSVQQGDDHVWVHNCDFFYGMPGSDKDQIKGDGSLDCKKSTYVTFSYNHFFDNGKCNLLGLSEGTTEDLYITYHHNWYDHSDSRHPRVRYFSAHVYNNYYDGNAKYGIGACLGSSIFAENNYFRNCPYPMMISMQGSDVADGKEGTFSSEAGGMIKAYGNVMVGAKSFRDQNSSSTEFDAVVVSNKSDKVSSSYKTVKGGNTYNNFDTSSIMYSYKLDSAQEAVTNVQTYAGRMNGGDFKWTFSDSDDSNSDVNSGLMSALKSYNTSLSSVGGNSISGAATQDPTTQATTAATTKATTATTKATTAATTKATTTAAATKYYFNPSKGLANSYFTVSGNLASDKGSVTYNGTTFKTCLKVESSTSIKFTTKSSNAKLTLVVKAKASGASIKVNGSTKFSDIGTTAVTKTITLGSAGTYEIRKGSGESYIYYIIVEDGTSTVTTQATTKATTAATTKATTQATTKATTAAATKYYFNPSKGLANSYFTVSGNLASDKGSVTYNGTTFKTCLKVESSTSIKFTTKSSNAKLTLVVKAKASGASIKVNGSTKFSDIGTTAVTKTITLGSAGTYEIKKGSGESYIYYIIVEDGASTVTQATTKATTQATTKATTQATTKATTQATTATTKATTATPSTGDIYVSPSGKSSAKGTSSDPMDLVTAISKIQAGKTIWMTSGTYKFSQTILISESNSGKSGAYKKISSINGGTVTLDFNGMAEAGANRGIVLDGSYWYFYDIDITNAGDNGMLLSGDNNIIELCQFYANHDSGLQISRYNTNYTSISQWPSNNLIKNCTAFNNKDEATAENADGFAAKLTCGEGNVFDGCMSYCNSDDGWDLYAKEETGSIGVVTLKNCVAFGNGKLTSGTGSANGDMNGFKLGGSNGKVPTPHVVDNCLAFKNGATGFTDNGNGGAIKMSNCTAVDNGVYNSSKANYMCYRTSSSATYKNLVSFYTGSIPTNDKFLGKLTNVVYAYKGAGYYLMASGSFSGTVSKGSSTYDISASSFKSVSIPGYSSGKYATNYHEVFRNSDGSINMNGLYQLASSSAAGKAGLGAKLD